MAYALGVPPESDATAALPALGHDGQGNLQLVVRARAGDAALAFKVRSGSNLNEWAEHPLVFDPTDQQWEVAGPGVAVASATDLGHGIWEVRLALDRALPRQFWLLQVKYDP
jgi:hypothetical protein